MTANQASNLPPHLQLCIDDDIEVRLFESSDAEVVYELTMRNRDHLSPWMAWIDGVTGITDTHAFLVGAERSARELTGFTAGIWYRGLLVGAISFHDIDWPNKCASLGYWLDAGHTGRGIMTRTVRAFCEYGFHSLGLHRLQIRAALENHASRRIPERLGFTFEGVLREAQYIRGKYLDHALYALLRT